MEYFYTDLSLSKDDKKILILTSPRSGSTYATYSIAAEGNLVDYGEAFLITDKTIPAIVSKIKTYPNYTVKVFGSQIYYDKDTINELCSISDKTVYLYRRNFKEQVLSFLACLVGEDLWVHEGTTAYIKRHIANSRLPFYNSPFKDRSKTEVINLPRPSQRLIDMAVNITIENYEFMAETYQLHPGPVICLEEFKLSAKDNRVINWEEEFDIPEFDVEELFYMKGLITKAP